MARQCVDPTLGGNRCRRKAFYQLGDDWVCGHHLKDRRGYAPDIAWDVPPSEAPRAGARVQATHPNIDPGKASPLTPACWSWIVTDETRALVQRLPALSEAADLLPYVTAFHEALRSYDHGFCAICGLLDNPVEDHDHLTGRVRGWLCRSCNTREGMNRDPDSVFGKYRQMHPYKVLGIVERYSGFGWEDGRPLGEEVWPPPPRDRWRDNAMRGVL